MSADMFERRFRNEIEKLPIFVPNDVRDPEVWEADFPAWRALFSSLCQYGHSTAYTLPSYEKFFRYCETAYTKRHPKLERYGRYFEQHLPGMAATDLCLVRIRNGGNPFVRLLGGGDRG